MRRLAKIIETSAVGALNRAGKSAASNVSKEIRKQYTIKKKDLDQKVKTTKGSLKNPEFVVEIPARGISLFEFGSPKQFGKPAPTKPGVKRRKRRKSKNAGVKVTVIKRRRQLFADAFIASMQYGTGIFKRRSSKRGDVKLLYGTQAAQLFGSDQSVQLFADVAADRFAKDFFNNVERKLN